MKILLITRGSQGDVLSSLGVARELVNWSHEVTVNLPRFLWFLKIIDQPYWAYRVRQSGLGPEKVKISKVTEKELERKVCDLVSNPRYKENAALLGEQIRNEGDIANLCDYIESFDRK